MKEVLLTMFNTGDKLPEDGQRCLYFAWRQWFFGIFYSAKREGVPAQFYNDAIGIGYDARAITWWMPEPPAPEMEMK